MSSNLASVVFSAPLHGRPLQVYVTGPMKARDRLLGNSLLQLSRKGAAKGLL